MVKWKFVICTCELNVCYHIYIYKVHFFFFYEEFNPALQIIPPRNFSATHLQDWKQGCASGGNFSPSFYDSFMILEGNYNFRKIHHLKRRKNDLSFINSYVRPLLIQSIYARFNKENNVDIKIKESRFGCFDTSISYFFCATTYILL